jgi:hypothetical protein
MCFGSKLQSAEEREFGPRSAVVRFSRFNMLLETMPRQRTFIDSCDGG